MENGTGKKRRLLAWTLITIAALLTVSAIVLLSTPLDLTKYNDRIEAAIEARVNGEISLGSVIVKALPSPEVTLTQYQDHAQRKSPVLGRQALRQDKALPAPFRQSLLRR